MFESAEGPKPMTRRPKCGWIAAAILTLLAGAAQDGAQAAVLSGMEPLASHSSTVRAMFRLPGHTIGRLPGGRLPGVGKRPGPISKGLLNKTPKGVAGTNATGRTTGRPPAQAFRRSCTAASRQLGPRVPQAGHRIWLLSLEQSRPSRHLPSWEREALPGSQLPRATRVSQDSSPRRSPPRFSIASGTGRGNSWSR